MNIIWMKCALLIRPSIMWRRGRYIFKRRICAETTIDCNYVHLSIRKYSAQWGTLGQEREPKCVEKSRKLVLKIKHSHTRTHQNDFDAEIRRNELLVAFLLHFREAFWQQ